MSYERYNGGSPYDTDFSRVIDWAESEREQKRSIKVLNRGYDKAVYLESQAKVLEIIPDMHEAVDFFDTHNELVFHESPIESFPNSPYARIHRGARAVRRELMTETFMRAENFKEMPDELRTLVINVWQKFRSLPRIETPGLDSETVRILSNLPVTEEQVWARFRNGFLTNYALLELTLAAKYKYKTSTSQGYNRRAIQVAEYLLRTLDAVGSCTPWQMNTARQEYRSRVEAAAYDYITDDIGMGKHIRDGRMWSRTTSEDPPTQRWLEALKTGYDPQGI